MGRGMSYVRGFLYALLFACSSVLLGLTAYRIHATLTGGPDFLVYFRGYRYDPVIVELLVTSALGIILSVCLFGAILAGKQNTGVFIGEIIGLMILWFMWLVGGAVVSNRWSAYSICRNFTSYNCRILATVVAFSWINWALVTILAVTSCVVGSRDEKPTYQPPDTRHLNEQPVTTGTSTGPTGTTGTASTGTATSAV